MLPMGVATLSVIDFVVVRDLALHEEADAAVILPVSLPLCRKALHQLTARVAGPHPAVGEQLDQDGAGQPG
jgi:hypothetical protein